MHKTFIDLAGGPKCVLYTTSTSFVDSSAAIEIELGGILSRLRRGDEMLTTTYSETSNVMSQSSRICNGESHDPTCAAFSLPSRGAELVVQNANDEADKRRHYYFIIFILLLSYHGSACH